jgi:hypothetical protein
VLTTRLDGSGPVCLPYSFVCNPSCTCFRIHDLWRLWHCLDGDCSEDCRGDKLSRREAPKAFTHTHSLSMSCYPAWLSGNGI